MANRKWQIAKKRLAGDKRQSATGDKRFAILGLLAGGLLSLFGKSLPPPSTNDLKRADFKTSTQRLGIRFTQRIRDVFRFRWLRGS
jgi:hypothetical protein